MYIVAISALSSPRFQLKVFSAIPLFVFHISFKCSYILQVKYVTLCYHKKETMQFNAKLFHLFPSFKKRWNDGSPLPKTPMFFNTASLNLHSIPFHSGIFFPLNCFTFSSYHKEKKTSAMQKNSKTFACHDLYQTAAMYRSQTYSFYISLVDAITSLTNSFVQGAKMSIFLNCFPLEN